MNKTVINIIKGSIDSINDAIDSITEDMRDYHRHVNDEPMLRVEDIEFALNISREVRDKLLSNETTKTKFRVISTEYIAELEEIIKTQHFHDSMGFVVISLVDCRYFLNGMKALLFRLEKELEYQKNWSD